MQAIGYVALTVLILVVGQQWWLKAKANRIVGQPLPKLDGEMAERLQARGKALFYFFSPHCGPCRAMTPVIDRLAKDHDNVFKFDVSQDIELARTFGVMATPTVVAVSRTTIDAILLGPSTERRLRQLIE